MFEQGVTLRTWALAEEPCAGKMIDAELLPDHRREYLDYEGPISGDRGNVIRWDHGTFEVESDAPDVFLARVEGQTLQGRVRLTKMPGRDQRWGFSIELG